MHEQEHQLTATPRQRNFIIRWIRRVLKWIRNLFAFIGLVYTVVPLLLIWAVVNFGESSHPKKAPVVTSKDPYSLWLSLDDTISQSEPKMGHEIFQQLFGGDAGIYLPTVRLALRRAASDGKVKDLQIVLNGLSGAR